MNHNINKRSSHVLALVHDEAKGQNVYDAILLSEYLAKNTLWSWLNPATNKTIQKIDFFIISKLNDGYRLFKEVTIEQTSKGKTYEHLWFCSNLAACNDPDNPFVFHSMIAMSFYYQQSKDFQKEQKIKYDCFQSIENHYGKGIALLLIPSILKRGFLNPKYLLFHSFNYDFINTFFINSSLENLIQEKGIEIFNPVNQEENITLYQSLLIETLDKNPHHESYHFVKCLNSILTRVINSEQIDSFLNHSNQHIASLAQAHLCLMGKKTYIPNLRKSHPEWILGQVYELYLDILKQDPIDLTPNSLVSQIEKISKTSKDPMVLDLVLRLFDQFNMISPTWKSRTNICMKIACITPFSTYVVNKFAKSILNDEPDNALSLLSFNFHYTETYEALYNLSIQQINIGIKNKNKALYNEGVNNVIRIFNDRQKHTYNHLDVGGVLIEEITAFRSTQEFELIGIEMLKYTLQATPSNSNHMIKLDLANYFIRKGTTLETKEAYKWLSEIKNTNPNEPYLPYYFIRYYLRFVQNKDDLVSIETLLATLNKSDNKLPLFYLLKALWYSHPLKREHPEWYILASKNLIEAFKDADQSDTSFLIKNLHRFNILTEEDQSKCKADILSLLGLGDA